MARRTTGRRSQGWTTGIRAVGLSLLFIAVLASGPTAMGAALISSNVSLQTAAVWLDYQETDYSLENVGVTITPQPKPFDREPGPVAGKITRGVLNVGVGPGIPFLWQRGAGRLYLDLNRNGDLTDDGSFSSGRPVQPYYQTFSRVQLPVETALGRRNLSVDLNFSDYSSGIFCSASLRYLWQGKITLSGHEWQVGIIQSDLRQTNLLLNAELLLRDWQKRAQPFTVRDGDLEVVPLAHCLFIDGRAYRLECAAQAHEGAVAPLLTLTEEALPAGEIKITGKFIRRMVLTGATATVILDRPAGAVLVPAGSYGWPRVMLEQGGVRALNDGGQSPPGRAHLIVDAAAPAVLEAGGPLTNSVQINLYGRDLRMDYRLTGAGGEGYRLVNQDRSRPPTYAIYRGDKRIASGKFEFG